MDFPNAAFLNIATGEEIPPARAFMGWHLAGLNPFLEGFRRNAQHLRRFLDCEKFNFFHGMNLNLAPKTVKSYRKGTKRGR